MTHPGKVDHHQRIQEEFSRQSSTMGSSASFTDREILNRIRSAVLFSGPLRILDVGCGPGIVTAELAPHAKELVAFDLTPEMIAQARKRCKEAGFANVRFEIGQAERLPFEDASFDAVVSRYTFHHFSDPSTVLAEMVRVVRAKGRIVIVDIVSSEALEEAELNNALEILRDPSHVRMFPYSHLRRMIESSGLRLQREERWTKVREFNEWIQITNAPDRSKPLYTVMHHLARAGVKAGIDLRLEGNKVLFNHEGILFAADKI